MDALGYALMVFLLFAYAMPSMVGEWLARAQHYFRKEQTRLRERDDRPAQKSRGQP